MRTYVLFWMFIACYSSQAQNLLPNGGFETHSSCPIRHGQLTLAAGWDVPLNHGGSSDYYHTCASNPWMSLPHTVLFYQQPYKGQGFAGFYTYHVQGEYREYLSAQLDQELEADRTYLFKAVVVSGEEDVFQTAFQVAFTQERPSGGSGPLQGSSYLPLEAAWTSPIIRDTGQWQHVQFCYRAKGGEKFLTIGNFRSNAETDFAKSEPQVPDEFFSSAYMLIDEISLIPIDSIPIGEMAPLLGLPSDTVLCSGDSLVVKVHPRLKVVWTDGEVTNERILHTPGQYALELQDHCFEYTYRFRLDTVGEPQLHLPPDTAICLGDTLVLDVRASGKFRWADGDTDRLNSWADSGWIVGLLRNGCGETADSLYLSVHRCPDTLLPPDSGKCRAWIPNAFSPNGDGHNERFMPHLTCGHEMFLMQIYDRWGEMLFESEDPLRTWDGRYKGSDVPQGAVLVMIRYLDETGEVHLYHQMVQLVR